MGARTLRIGLVGDRDEAVAAHRAIPVALALAAGEFSCDVTPRWISTESIACAGPLDGLAALWCVPASPYRSMEGALRAIRFARETGLPFLGTCGGFQHAVIEYARNVLGWLDAEHGETAPDAPRQVIAPLSCSLVEVAGTIHFTEGSRIAAAYGQASAEERYHCRYGLNPAFREALTTGPLRVAATDELGDVRAIELDDHPFFAATLFQPERAALEGRLPAVVRAFIAAALH